MYFWPVATILIVAAALVTAAPTFQHGRLLVKDAALHSLTTGKLAWLRGRISCPATRDDIIQSVAIRLWELASDGRLPADPAHRERLTWRVLRGRIADELRSRRRRIGYLSLDEARDLPTGADHRTGSPDCADQVRDLLRHAGPYRPDLEDRLAGRPSDRLRVSRGIARIRAAIGQSEILAD